LVYVLNQFNLGHTVYPIISGYVGVAVTAFNADALLIPLPSIHLHTHTHTHTKGSGDVEYDIANTRICVWERAVYLEVVLTASENMM
jgi:hypothetical protein